MSNERYWHERDYYAVLDIPQTASAKEVKKAYRREALKWHPDKNPNKRDEATERFKALAEAFECLSDQSLRSRYDRHINVHGRGQQPAYTPPGNDQSSAHTHTHAPDATADPAHNDFHQEMHSRFDNFSFEHAEEVFRRMFGEDAAFSNNHSSTTTSNFPSSNSSSSSSSSPTPLSPEVGRSESTTTSTDNLGRTLTVKITRITRADGSVEEHKELQTQDAPAAGAVVHGGHNPHNHHHVAHPHNPHLNHQHNHAMIHAQAQAQARAQAEAHAAAHAAACSGHANAHAQALARHQQIVQQQQQQARLNHHT